MRFSLNLLNLKTPFSIGLYNSFYIIVWNFFFINFISPPKNFLWKISVINRVNSVRVIVLTKKNMDADCQISRPSWCNLKVQDTTSRFYSKRLDPVPLIESILATMKFGHVLRMKIMTRFTPWLIWRQGLDSSKYYDS